MSCTESLIQGLEENGSFTPLITVKRMKIGEGLTKIWMCPSSELAKALFSPPPHIIRDYAESTNLLHRYLKEQESDSESSDLYEDDDDSDDKSHEEGIDEEISELSELSVRSEQSEGDEKLNKFKIKMKQLYKEKLGTGVKMLLDNALATLDAELFNMVTTIRREEQETIDQILEPLSNFISTHQRDVYMERGTKLKKKYKLQRKGWITRTIDAAEESFEYLCIKLEKELRDKYLFSVQEMKNNHLYKYKHNFRKERCKYLERFVEERNALMNTHDVAVQELKKSHQDRLDELLQREMEIVQERMNEYKREISLNKSTPKVEINPIKICSENSAWLCIIYHLLKDMETFIQGNEISGIDPEQMDFIKRWDTKTSLYRFKGNKSKDFSSESQLMGSIDTIPCGKFKRDEILHRKLINEATQILEQIIDNITAGNVVNVTPPKQESIPLIKSHSSFVLGLHYQSDEDHSAYQLICDSDMNNVKDAQTAVDIHALRDFK